MRFEGKYGRQIRVLPKSKLLQRLLGTPSIRESEMGGGGIPRCRCDLLTGVAQPGGERSGGVAMATQAQNCRSHQLRSQLPVFFMQRRSKVLVYSSVHMC